MYELPNHLKEDPVPIECHGISLALLPESANIQVVANTVTNLTATQAAELALQLSVLANRAYELIEKYDDKETDPDQSA